MVYLTNYDAVTNHTSSVWNVRLVCGRRFPLQLSVMLVSIVFVSIIALHELIYLRLQHLHFVCYLKTDNRQLFNYYFLGGKSKLETHGPTQFFRSHLLLPVTFNSSGHRIYFLPHAKGSANLCNYGSVTGDPVCAILECHEAKYPFCPLCATCIYTPSKYHVMVMSWVWFPIHERAGTFVRYGYCCFITRWTTVQKYTQKHMKMNQR